MNRKHALLMADQNESSAFRNYLEPIKLGAERHETHQRSYIYWRFN